MESTMNKMSVSLPTLSMVAEYDLTRGRDLGEVLEEEVSRSTYEEQEAGTCLRMLEERMDREKELAQDLQTRMDEETMRIDEGSGWPYWEIDANNKLVALLKGRLEISFTRLNELAYCVHLLRERYRQKKKEELAIRKAAMATTGYAGTY
jgi:hypothetical protein